MKTRHSTFAIMMIAASVAFGCGEFSPPEPKKKEPIQKPESAVSKSEPLTPAIGARLVSIGHPNEFMGESFIAITIDIINNSELPITSIKGHFDFISPDGLSKHSLGVDANGKLDGKSVTRVMWKWSSWSGDGISIMGNGMQNYNIVFVPTQITLGDGTIIKSEEITSQQEKTKRTQL